MNLDSFQYFIPAENNAQMVALVRAHLFVDAAVEMVRTEIVETMESAPPRTGREYVIPGTGSRKRQRKRKKLKRPKYTASAPGEPPAIREGLYLAAWKTTPAVQAAGGVVGTAYNDRRVGAAGEYLLGELLEYGTSDLVNYRVRMEPRPHIRPALETVRPKIADLARQMSA